MINFLIFRTKSKKNQKNTFARKPRIALTECIKTKLIRTVLMILMTVFGNNMSTKHTILENIAWKFTENILIVRKKG